MSDNDYELLSQPKPVSPEREHEESSRVQVGDHHHRQPHVLRVPVGAIQEDDLCHTDGDQAQCEQELGDVEDRERYPGAVAALPAGELEGGGEEKEGGWEPGQDGVLETF